LGQARAEEPLQFQRAASGMLNADGYNLTEMRCERLYLKFELNLPQMPSSFENWHSHFIARVKAHRKTGPDSAPRPNRKTGWATTMWFLIKGSFWFGLVLVLLSLFSSESSTRLANDPKIQFSDAFTAASGAYDYLTGMCSEKPDVCAKGAETFTALGYRAREGARVAYELLDSQFAGDKTAAPKPAEATPAALRGAAPVAAVAPTINEEKAAALNQPMPYRPPVDDGSVSDEVVTGTIPLPTPKPVL
jgi:hypothetical protein